MTDPETIVTAFELSFGEAINLEGEQFIVLTFAHHDGPTYGYALDATEAMHLVEGLIERGRAIAGPPPDAA